MQRLSKPAPAILMMAALLALVTLVGCQQNSRHETSAAQATPQTAAGPVRDLSQDEAAGGHTLEKHVGRSDGELRERLRREGNISAASTYTDRETAERTVGTVLQQEQAKIQGWLEHENGHANLVLDYDGNPAHPIGRTLRRGEDRAQPCSQAVVVVKWTGRNEYYVLTSYPECR